MEDITPSTMLLVTRGHSMLTAVLIKGNPKYINNNLARLYYKDIVSFVESLGVKITTDPGASFTCPVAADFYIGHSRGCSRSRCTGDTIFLKFGDLDGINHPLDHKWIMEYKPGFTKGDPPAAHFIFTEEQQQAIVDTVVLLNKKKT